MKKLYRILSLIALITAIAAFSSCKKLLEQEPKNSTYLQAYWKSAQDARNAIAGNYALLRNALNDKNSRYYMYGDAIAKNYFTIQYTGDGLEGIQNGDFTFQYNLNSLANYRLFFKSIAMSNVVIKNVGNMSNEQLSDEEDPLAFRNNILGQAYFLRALSYFMMVRVWGDVPVVTEAYDDPINAPQLPRSPKADVMKAIEDDCHTAASLLTWRYTNTGDAKVTANRGSVYALLAHLYMWRATMTDVSNDNVNMTDINSADTTINSIVANGGYTHTDTANYKNIFVGRSSESIFELNMSENTLEGSKFNIGIYFLNYDYVNDFPFNDIGREQRFFVVQSYLNSHFPASDTTDVRFKKNFTLTSTPNPMCVKYANVIYRNPGQKLDYYLSNNMIIFRLSDMELLKAEIALYRNDVPTATNIINTFRRRYNATPSLLAAGLTRDEVMDAYIIERGKELYLEGHLFYDLLRTRRYANTVDWLTESRFRLSGFYWPVDPALFRQNPLLKQTTYWLGKV